MAYNLFDKVVIITGANSGIGKAAAIQLAKAGAMVIMACRHIGRGEQALQEVRSTANSKKVDLMRVDMSSQVSIHQFASEFLLRYSRLDVLIHNAANFDQTLKTPTLTDDSIETIFATNHIGPFLLTQLLLDVLKASAPSRIITVASKGLMKFPFLDIEFDNLNGEKKFSVTHAYYHAKLAQIMFTYDLARRLKDTGITVNCVRVANVALPDKRLMNIPTWLRKLYNVKRKFAITADRQAETYLYLAADPSLADVTGKYWDENNQQVESNKNSYKIDTWDWLWDVSTRLAGLEAKT